MLWLVNFYLDYRDYLSFVFWAIFVSLFFYFFVSTFLEMSMDLLKRNMQTRYDIVAAVFALINTILFVLVIYYFSGIYIDRGINSLGILFLLIAWSFLVIPINKRFNVKPWFSFLLFNVSWLGILLLWLQS